MVVAEIREDERREADAVEAPEVGVVRRRLDRAAEVAGVEHRPESAVEVEDHGRPRGCGDALRADLGLDRAVEARPPAGGLEDRVQQVGGRRLPARARDADDRQRLGRPAPELVGDGRERGASVGHDELRRGEVESPFRDERDGAVRDRLCGPVVPVDAGAADAEEDAAGADAPCVDDQILDHAPSVAGSRRRLERGEHVAQLHGEIIHHGRMHATRG